MNRLLLKEVRDRIASDPEHFDISSWFHDARDPDDPDNDAGTLGWSSFLRELSDKTLEQFTTACGTSACIAGWACLLRLEQAQAILDANPDMYMSELATDLLELPSYVTARLFYVSAWPYPYYTQVVDGDISTATAAVQLIDELLNGNNPWEQEGDLF